MTTVNTIVEKIDEIQASQEAKLSSAIEAIKAEMSEMVSKLEAKVASVEAPAVQVKQEKTVRGDVNKRVKEALSEVAKGGRLSSKEIQLFADESEAAAFMQETSQLTASGTGKGGRTDYDPVFRALRQANPLRMMSEIKSTTGSDYQFRAKVGNAGAAWGYAINNDSGTPNLDNFIWTDSLSDLNVRFPVRTAVLDDVDGDESVIVEDLLAEFAQAEGQAFVKGATGFIANRGLSTYSGANATFTGGTNSSSAIANGGNHSLATYDQLTASTNTAINVTYKDVVNLIHALPNQYWDQDLAFMISPVMLAGIRGLTDTNGAPIFQRTEGLTVDGFIGMLLGYPVYVNQYLDSPFTATAASSIYPMYFGAWKKGHTIVDRLNMTIRRYDQTAPGFITFFGEKRVTAAVKDPLAVVRYRSRVNA